MDSLTHIDLEEQNLRFALIVAIGSMTCISLFYLMLTIIKKNRRARKNEQREIYQKHIDDVLFKLLFESNQQSFPEFNTTYFNAVLFKKLAIKSIVSLHRSYAGDYQKRLQAFYVTSELVNYSLKKITSSKWPAVVEGTRDLCNLQYMRATPHIRALLKHPSKLVQKEALLGLIRLNQFDELLTEKAADLYMDDWLQSEILYTVKITQLPEPPNLMDLLGSSNSSLVLLAARLAHYYKNFKYVEVISNALEKQKNGRIKNELQLIINQLKLS